MHQRVDDDTTVRRSIGIKMLFTDEFLDVELLLDKQCIPCDKAITLAICTTVVGYDCRSRIPLVCNEPMS